MRQQCLMILLVTQLTYCSVVTSAMGDTAAEKTLDVSAADPNEPLSTAAEPAVWKQSGSLSAGNKGRNGTGQGIGYPGNRGQGGSDYAAHRQYGNPPRESTGESVAAQKTLLQAATRGDVNAVEALLLQGADPNARAADKNQRTALILASAGGHRATVTALLAGGANIENKDASSLTALNWAAMRSRNNVAESLLDNGADVNTRDRSGASPLLYAVGTQNAPLVDLFTAAGAELEAESDESKMTPLLLAIELGNSRVARSLIANGADVNGTNSIGFTPLMAAAEKGQVDLIALLLEKGSDKEARDSGGASAQSLAQKNGHSEALKLLTHSH